MKLSLSIRLFLIVALLMTVFAFGQSPQRVAAASLNVVVGQKIAIPSYFYPGALWTRLENSVPVPRVALINPNSGPGASQDANYAAEVVRARAKGIRVLGYVYTSYGARASATVQADVNKYYTWYGVDGIFFDEASTNCAITPYYQTLYNFVKAKGGLARVFINPGTNSPECYINVADVIVNFESSYSAYISWQPSSWVFKYPANRFWQLVYATPSANLSNAIALSKNRNAGFIYVTPDVMSNPWDTLPPSTYWTTELNLVQQ